MTRYLTIEAAADALSVSTDTIRRMLPRLGAVDIARPGARKRLIRIPEKALEGWLQEQRILPPVPPVEKHKTKPFYIERRKA